MNEPSDFPPSAPTSRSTWIALGLVLLAVCAGLLFPALHTEKGARRIDKVTGALSVALVRYKKEFGSFPVGNSRVVSKALQGENPTRMRFIELAANEVSSDGDLLDPWGTPYQFYFSGDRPLIRSAGQNRQLDNSSSKKFDDYFQG